MIRPKFARRRLALAAPTALDNHHKVLAVGRRALVSRSRGVAVARRKALAEGCACC